MIAARWQAWAALGVVVAAVIGFFVLDDDSPDPRRQWSYDPPRRELMDRVVDGMFDSSIAYRVDLEPKVRERAPVAAAKPYGVQLRVTPTGMAIDGGDEQEDELALAILTIKARVDPGLPLLLDVGEDVPWDRLIQVMDAARKAGFENIGLGRTL